MRAAAILYILSCTPVCALRIALRSAPLTDQQDDMWIALDGPNGLKQSIIGKHKIELPLIRSSTDTHTHTHTRTGGLSKLNRPGCKAILRSNYVCTSDNKDLQQTKQKDYADWLLKWEDALNELEEKSSQVKNPKRILMLGDSHVNQIYTSLACLHHKDILSYQALKYNAANENNNGKWAELQWPGIMDKTLSDFDPSGNCQVDRSCSNQVSKFQLRNGFEVYLIYNHPVEYFNSTQLESMLRGMHLKLDSLDMVVMGNVHDNLMSRWPQEYLFDGKTMPKDGAWTVHTIGDLLYHNGFTGRYVIIPQPEDLKYRMPPDWNSFVTKYADKFSVVNASELEFLKEPEDARPFPDTDGDHLCVPGPLDWLAANIAHGA